MLRTAKVSHGAGPARAQCLTDTEEENMPKNSTMVLARPPGGSSERLGGRR